MKESAVRSDPAKVLFHWAAAPRGPPLRVLQREKLVMKIVPNSEDHSRYHDIISTIAQGGFMQDFSLHILSRFYLLQNTLSVSLNPTKYSIVCFDLLDLKLNSGYSTKKVIDGI